MYFFILSDLKHLYEIILLKFVLKDLYKDLMNIYTLMGILQSQSKRLHIL